MFGLQQLPKKDGSSRPAPQVEPVPVETTSSNRQATEQLPEGASQATPILDAFAAEQDAEATTATPALLEVQEPTVTSMGPDAHVRASPPPGSRSAPAQQKVKGTTLGSD